MSPASQNQLTSHSFKSQMPKGCTTPTSELSKGGTVTCPVSYDLGDISLGQKNQRCQLDWSLIHEPEVVFMSCSQVQRD